MSKFKVGDRVRRTGPSLRGCLNGSVYIVKKVYDDGDIRLRGLGSWIWDYHHFEPAYPNPPHKHAELIKAWADGAVIQCRSKRFGTDRWVDCSHNSPSWIEGVTYRIKPNEPTPKEKAQAKLEELMKQAEELKCQIDNM